MLKKCFATGLALLVVITMLQNISLTYYTYFKINIHITLTI